MAAVEECDVSGRFRWTHLPAPRLLVWSCLGHLSRQPGQRPCCLLLPQAPGSVLPVTGGACLCVSVVCLSPAFKLIPFCVHHSCLSSFSLLDIVFSYRMGIFILLLHRHLFGGCFLPLPLKAAIVCFFFPMGGMRLLSVHVDLHIPFSVRVYHRKKVFSYFWCLFQYRTMMNLLDKWNS